MSVDLSSIEPMTDISRIEARRKWLYLIILLGLIFRFFHPFFAHPYDRLYSDPDRHYTNIRDCNFGQGIYSILDAPLPQFWLKAVLFIVGDTNIGVSVYLGLLSAVMPWLWYRWGREIFASKNIALGFYGAIAWLPSWIGIYTFFMDETLSIAALGAALWLSWRAKRKQTAASLLIAALVWSIAICIKQIVIFELLIVVPWMLISYISHPDSPNPSAEASAAPLGRSTSRFGWLKPNRRWGAAVLASLIIVCSYLTYPLWVYRGLGSTWLFSPCMGCMTRGYYLSDALSHSATFLSHGQLLWQTGHFGSNAMCTESLAPFWHWKTWRVGIYNLVIDLDKPLYLALPVPHPPWKKRLRLLAESFLYFFFSRSWPDDRADDFIETLQVQMRWLWSILSVSILIMAMAKNRLKDMPVILCLGTAFLYIICDCSTIEGRYRKPWEGTAVAAFIYLISEKKKNRQLKEPGNKFIQG